MAWKLELTVEWEMHSLHQSMAAVMMVPHLGEASVFCLDDEDYDWYQMTAAMVKPMVVSLME